VLVVELVRRKQLATGYSLLWIITSVALLVLSLWRHLLDLLANLIGIFYPPAALFVVGFGFILLILLQFSLIISRLSRENKILAQQIGLIRSKLAQLQSDSASGEPGNPVIGIHDSSVVF
jgi:hypothetical protein